MWWFCRRGHGGSVPHDAGVRREDPRESGVHAGSRVPGTRLPQATRGGRGGLADRTHVRAAVRAAHQDHGTRQRSAVDLSNQLLCYPTKMKNNCMAHYFTYRLLVSIGNVNNKLFM